MACVDDDEQVEYAAAPLLRYRLSMSAAPVRQLTKKEETYKRIMHGKWRTENHYIPFKRTAWHPIGCTRTHAFAMLQNEDAYTPIVMDLTYRSMVRPSQRMASTREFVSPWTRYSDSFSNFLGGCAHKNVMCIVMSSSVILMTADWRVHLRDNTIALQKLVSCSMNDQYLVVFGVETGKSVQSMFVYYLDDSVPHKVLYRSRIEPPVVCVNLLQNVPDAMLVQCDNGRTRRIVIDKDKREYKIRDVGDLKTGSVVDRPLAAKELHASSFLAQLVNKDIVVVKPKGVVERSFGLQQMVVDVIDYEDDLIVCHDASNTVHFFDENLVKIATVPWEHIASAVLLYEDGIPSILKPYSSLSCCADDPTTVVLLASFGALVTIKML